MSKAAKLLLCILILLFLGATYAQDIRKTGSLVGKIESNGDVRLGGRVIGRFESNGDIRVGGSVR